MTMIETDGTGSSTGEALGPAEVLAARGQGADHGAERCQQLRVIAWAGKGPGMSQGSGDC